MGVDRHDELTGLLSLRGFQEQLREVAAGAPPEEPGWVLVTDLDRLQDLDARHGHAAVDGYLKAVASVLRGALAPPHRPARLGGDEFGAILRDLPMGDSGRLGEAVRSAVESLDHPLEGSGPGTPPWPRSEP
jgi:diguanylate cyclase (GGDEF)-like protein